MFICPGTADVISLYKYRPRDTIEKHCVIAFGERETTAEKPFTVMRLKLKYMHYQKVLDRKVDVVQCADSAEYIRESVYYDTQCVLLLMKDKDDKGKINIHSEKCDPAIIHPDFD